MRIGLVSLNPAWEDKIRSFEACREAVFLARENRCELVVFPEMTLTGFSVSNGDLVEAVEDSDTVQKFSDLAREGAISIVFGLVLREGEKSYNSAVAVSKEGKVVARYDKRHLFPLVDEGRFRDEGDKQETFVLNGVRFGMSICFDLRFPFLFWEQAEYCDAILNLANWPKARLSHWKTLLASRAIENQLFAIGVNRTGKDGNGLEYAKSSFVYDPLGRKVSPLYSQGKLDVFDINAKDCVKTRAMLPFRWK